ncbi:MAG TPA: VCBS repeat-containing protein [Fimbriimonadaceae bacterium]|nr:VCBS repeat-containing protein [Fimbriimonadaceae bacterium]
MNSIPRVRSLFSCAAILALTSVAFAQDLPFFVAPGPGLNAPIRRFMGISPNETGSVFPYPGFAGGVTVAAGDVNGDGVTDIISGLASGPSHVKVLSGRDFSELRSFFAFDGGYSGGIYVGSGDLNGDGHDDILVSQASGPGGINVFSGKDGAILHTLLPFGPVNGVRVAAGDVNGDGFADMICSRTPGSPPQVRVLSGVNQAMLSDFLPFDTGFNGGVYVSAGDVDGDGTAEVIAATGPGTQANVRVFKLPNLQMIANFNPFGGYAGGARVGAGDLNGDGKSEVIVGTAPGDSNLKIFSGTPFTEAFMFFPYGPGVSNGIYLAGPGGGPRNLVSFTVAPTQVVGGSTVTGFISLDKPAPRAGTRVVLISSSSAIVPPAEVMIPFGQSSAQFPVITKIVSTVSLRQIAAELGARRIVKHLTLTPGLKSFNISPGHVIGGGFTNGYVQLHGNAPTGGTEVTITPNSSILTTPATVRVLAGTDQVMFRIDAAMVGADYVRTVTATLAGITRTASVTIQRPVRLQSLSVSPSTVRGGDPTTGTITSDIPARSTGFKVDLSSSSSAILIPADVVIPAGATSQTFGVSTQRVGATYVRSIRASQDGITRTFNITLTP